MYVHIGGDINIPVKTIEAIINLETVLPVQNRVSEFINSEDDKNRLEYLSDDIPRSMIVASDRTYLSSLSVSVLRRRMNENMSV